MIDAQERAEIHIMIRQLGAVEVSKATILMQIRMAEENQKPINKPKPSCPDCHGKGFQVYITAQGPMGWPCSCTQKKGSAS